MPYGTQQWDSVEEEEKSDVMRRAENARFLLEKQVKGWVLEETAIRVKCKAYVITDMSSRFCCCVRYWPLEEF